MNILKIIIPGLILALCACQSSKKEQTNLQPSTALEYDSLLAAEVGADDYGMRSYVIANLIAGPNRSQDSVEASRLQRAHLDNIARMAEEGTLVLAGPFLDDQEIRGYLCFCGGNHRRSRSPYQHRSCHTGGPIKNGAQAMVWQCCTYETQRSAHSGSPEKNLKN